MLSEMVRELRGFGELIRDVEARSSFAATIEERSVQEHRTAWNRCLEDLKTNPKYAASEALRAMEPQIGLVPLGIDRASGLWEFWHVDSGERPRWEGSEPAAHPSVDPRGKVKLAEDGSTGIVLVLLPGGSFWMGASKEEGAQNHDPDTQDGEGPVHQVTLQAFFLAKYEVTQGQWLRLMGDNPSQYQAGNPNYVGGTVTPLHPVSNVNWEECREAMHRWDLELPPEARWEYACRAGTSTAYWCGDSVASIQERRAGNIADLAAFMQTSGWTCTTEVDDGHLLQAPVGSFAANEFGLHDVLGNVWEWCEDPHTSYSQPPRPGDGLRNDMGSRNRVFRGGSFNNPALSARSAYRSISAPAYRSNIVGCRPSRGVH